MAGDGLCQPAAGCVKTSTLRREDAKGAEAFDFYMGTVLVVYNVC